MNNLKDVLDVRVRKGELTQDEADDVLLGRRDILDVNLESDVRRGIITQDEADARRKKASREVTVDALIAPVTFVGTFIFLMILSDLSFTDLIQALWFLISGQY